MGIVRPCLQDEDGAGRRERNIAFGDHPVFSADAQKCYCQHGRYCQHPDNPERSERGVTKDGLIGELFSYTFDILSRTGYLQHIEGFRSALQAAKAIKLVTRAAESIA